MKKKLNYAVALLSLLAGHLLLGMEDGDVDMLGANLASLSVEGSSAPLPQENYEVSAPLAAFRSKFSLQEGRAWELFLEDMLSSRFYRRELKLLQKWEGFADNRNELIESKLALFSDEDFGESVALALTICKVRDLKAQLSESLIQLENSHAAIHLRIAAAFERVYKAPEAELFSKRFSALRRSVRELECNCEALSSFGSGLRLDSIVGLSARDLGIKRTESSLTTAEAFINRVRELQGETERFISELESLPVFADGSPSVCRRGDQGGSGALKRRRDAKNNPL